MKQWQQARWIDAMEQIDLELIGGEFPDQDLQMELAAAATAPETAENAAPEAAKKETPGTGRRAAYRRSGRWLAAVSGIAAAFLAIMTVAVMAGRRMRQPA